MVEVKDAAQVEIIDQHLEKSLLVPVILFILAMLYDISPVDMIPDIPVIGHIDDALVTLTATLNLLQKSLGDFSGFLASLLGLAKWLVISTGIIAVSLIGLFIWSISKLM
ncbi:MAG: DUF1232 domain-containing protein [Syntrophorhabdaceae bacterium]|nr:DUF1232 domain-containing protein [Syntrophorhabdaceae bacterium]